MRLHRAVGLALAIEAAVTAAAFAALLGASGWSGHLPDLALPLFGSLVVGSAAAWILRDRLATALRKAFRDIGAAAWSGVEGRFRPAREGSFHEVREAAAAFNAMAEQAGRTIAALDLEKSTLEAVLAHMYDAVLVLDPSGGLTHVNAPAERIFGLVAPLVVGHRLIEVLRHYELDALVRQVERERTPLGRELEVYHPEHRLLRVQANPVTGRQGQVLGTVVVAQDITGLLHADLVRREFVANVSHELRTPLSSVRALAEALAAGAAQDPVSGPRFLEQIIAEIDRLALLVNDLLDLSAIESGSAKMEMEAISLNDVIEDVLSKFRPVADRRGVALRGETPAGDLPRVWADRARLTQALANLVDNAIKYTSQGGTVTVSGQERADLVALSVADTGVGIAPQHLSRIFERFYRVDPSRSRALGGTGLGLSIVKHIATSHGGRVEVESTEGHGSTFRLLLPRASVGVSAVGSR